MNQYDMGIFFEVYIQNKENEALNELLERLSLEGDYEDWYETKGYKLEVSWQW